jgi:hypothetical protein
MQNLKLKMNQEIEKRSMTEKKITGNLFWATCPFLQPKPAQTAAHLSPN